MRSLLVDLAALTSWLPRPVLWGVLAFNAAAFLAFVAWLVREWCAGGMEKGEPLTEAEAADLADTLLPFLAATAGVSEREAMDRCQWMRPDLRVPAQRNGSQS